MTGLEQMIDSDVLIILVRGDGKREQLFPLTLVDAGTAGLLASTSEGARIFVPWGSLEAVLSKPDRADDGEWAEISDLLTGIKGL